MRSPCLREKDNGLRRKMKKKENGKDERRKERERTVIPSEQSGRRKRETETERGR
jgi:hypothetical protein